MKTAANKQQDPAIMVTGGAGFVGQQVVRQLAEQGRTVVALYHHKLPESLDNVYPVGSDMGSPELLAAPLRGIETVVHLAWEGGLIGPPAPVKFDPASPTPLPRNAQVTKNLLVAMERAGTRRIIFVSASGASRMTATPFLQEKYLCEYLVLNSKIPEKMIIRSSVVFGGQGSSDRFLRSIMRVMKFPVYPVPRERQSMAPIHVQDLAATLVSACKYPAADPASLLDVQGGENYQVQDIYRIVSDRCVKGTRFQLPSFLGSSLMPLFERDRRTEQQIPRISHFMALGIRSTDGPKGPNPLTAVVPKKLSNFKDRVVE